MSEYKENNDHRFGRLMLNPAESDIEAEELANACRRLGISGPLEPLLRELKIKDGTTKPITQTDSIDSPRKVSQKKEKRHPSRNRESSDCLGENFESVLNQKGNKNSYGQESWGRDSGARDLSPEPNRILDDLMAEAHFLDNESPGGTSAMIHLASKLQVAALSALKTEVLELSTRLQNSERERDSIQKKLGDALEEKERSQRRLEAIASAHESRITEMHCVIVELSKKLKNQQDSAIIEEHEPDGSVSELSFQEGSVYNSEMECTNLDQQSITEPLDVKLIQTDQKSENQFGIPGIKLTDQQSETHYSLINLNTMGGQVQLQAMQEEILYLRSHIALLQSKLASVEDNVNAEKPKINITDSLCPSPRPRSNTSEDLGESAEIFDPSMVDDTIQDSNRSKRVHTNSHQNYLSSNISPKIDRIPNRGVNLRQRNNSDEMVHRLIDASQDLPQNIPDTQLRNEIERLKHRIEHFRVQNNVLDLSLADSKSMSERFYLLCGKYESNAIALNQALNCSDRTIEAYDVMLALLESKLGIMENAESAIESRKAAETVAKHLMARLESETNIQGNSLGPWQDAATLYSGNNGANTSAPWTDEDDAKLRAQMSKLKGQRATIQNTVVNLESPYFSETDKSPISGKSMYETRKGDLETAVLMQELMSMREELAEFKCRAESAEQEKNQLHEKLTVMQQAFFHLQAQLADSEALLALNSKDRTSYSEAEHSAGIEHELVEALARESRLKARLQSLAGSLEAATKSSEEKYAQVQNTVSELKQANLSLTQSLERCKRKYQARLKRMEQQLLEMSVKHQQSPNKAVPETTL